MIVQSRQHALDILAHAAAIDTLTDTFNRLKRLIDPPPLEKVECFTEETFHVYHAETSGIGFRN